MKVKSVGIHIGTYVRRMFIETARYGVARPFELTNIYIRNALYILFFGILKYS